eukprot:gene9085-biopygen3185
MRCPKIRTWGGGINARRWCGTAWEGIELRAHLPGHRRLGLDVQNNVPRVPPQHSDTDIRRARAADQGLTKAQKMRVQNVTGGSRCSRKYEGGGTPPTHPPPLARPGPGLWRGTQAVAPNASQLGCREAAPKAPRLAPKAPPSAPKAQKCPQITRECPGHAQ